MNNVGVIIPTKGQIPLLQTCVRSIIEKTSHKFVYIYIADTGSTEDEIKTLVNFLKSFENFKNIKLIRYNWYNFGKINNDVVFKHIDSNIEYLVFCNNDIELIDDCITTMLKFCKKKNVGTVGCKLLYPDGTIQHAGQKFYFKPDPDGKINFMVTHRSLRERGDLHNDIEVVFGNTAGFCMVKRNVFEDIGGFNEKYLECFEDVEFNVQCMLRGLQNIYVGNKRAYHKESQSRKNSLEKNKREYIDFYHRFFPFMVEAYKKLGDKIVL